MALDLIRQSPGFQWQSECILFLRAWLNFFPNREWEIIQRMKEGSFDIGMINLTLHNFIFFPTFLIEFPLFFVWWFQNNSKDERWII